MNIRFIVADRQGVCTRQRVELFVPELLRRGHAVDIAEFPKASRARRLLFADCARYDSVVLLRRLLTWLDWRRLRRCSAHLVYDYDDALWLRDPNRPNPRSRNRERRLFRILRGVDRVIAGNEVLAELARRLNDSVSVLPTCVDETVLIPARDDPDTAAPDTVTLGWIGSRSTVQYLGLIEGALRRLASQRPTVRLKIVSDEFGSFNVGMPVERKPWRLEDQLSDLQSMDIGLMPLTDDPWSRGKCAFKLVQYGAVARPSVASPVGANCQAIRDGKTGYLAGDDHAWVDCLTRLVDDADLRRRMGQAAREHIVAGYSVAARQQEFARLVTGR